MKAREPRHNDAEPLVSCILPTADRVALAKLAIGCFERQDYPARELVVVDDGPDDGLAAFCAGRFGVRYLRLAGPKSSVGFKRNAACEAARGDVIVHWDDDDWSARGRVSRLVAGLGASGRRLIGQQELYFYRPADGAAWLYACPAVNRERWLAGGSLAYRRSLWERHLFPDRDNGEDWAFVQAAAAEEPFAICEEPSLYVATVHPGNTCFKDTLAPFYRPRPTAEVEALFGLELAAWREACRVVAPGREAA